MLLKETTMERTIITEPARNLRFLGRKALAGNWAQATMVIVIMVLCTQIPALLIDTFFGKPRVVHTVIGGQDVDITMGNTSALSGIFTMLVIGAFALGASKYFLALIRKQSHNTGQIFSGFEYFGKALALMLLYSIFVFLWTLLLIVPGIIAAFRYSQAFYILADDPQKGVMECLQISKEMMRDNKFKLFCVDLSFIGWMILAAIPTGIISAAITVATDGAGINYFLTSLILLVANVATYIVTAYMSSTQTVFYEMLNGKTFQIERN